MLIGPELVYGALFDRFEAHICICFTAYTILLELERTCKLSSTIYRWKIR